MSRSVSECLREIHAAAVSGPFRGLHRKVLRRGLQLHQREVRHLAETETEAETHVLEVGVAQSQVRAQVARVLVVDAAMSLRPKGLWQGL